MYNNYLTSQSEYISFIGTIKKSNSFSAKLWISLSHFILKYEAFYQYASFLLTLIFIDKNQVSQTMNRCNRSTVLDIFIAEVLNFNSDFWGKPANIWSLCPFFFHFFPQFISGELIFLLDYCVTLTLQRTKFTSILEKLGE